MLITINIAQIANRFNAVRRRPLATFFSEN